MAFWDKFKGKKKKTLAEIDEEIANIKSQIDNLDEKEVDNMAKNQEIDKDIPEEEDELEEEEIDSDDEEEILQPKPSVKPGRPVKPLPQPIRQVPKAKEVKVEKAREVALIKETEPGIWIPGMEEGQGLTERGALLWIINKLLEIGSKV